MILDRSVMQKEGQEETMPKRKETVMKYRNISIYRREVLEKVNIKSVEQLQLYLKNLALSNRKPTTIERDIATIIRWLEYIYDEMDDKCILDMTTEDIEEYAYYLKSKRDNKPRTISNVLSVIEDVYDYLLTKGTVSSNPASKIKKPKEISREYAVKRVFLTEEQVEDLKLKLEQCGDIQLQTYINFGLSTAARANACASLKWEQIDFDKRMCIDVMEKKSKLVTLYFNEYTKSLLLKLQEYRKEHHINDGGYVFISNKYRYYEDTGEKTHICSSTLGSWVKKAGKMIDVPDLTPHDLRRTSANLLLQRGGDIGVVSLLLNHSNISTTFRYYISKDQNEYLREYKDKFDF